MFCTKCGKELNSGDRFCAHCGAESRQNESQLHKYDDVVFNPPFRIEAERKTAEIIKAREEFRGFSEPEREAPAAAKERERININWNLDGLPASEQKKTEEVNFDWGEFVERRNATFREPLDKFEFEPIMAERATGLGDSYGETHIADKPFASDKGEKAERILDTLFGVGAGRELLKEEPPEPVVEQINVNRDASENESIISLEDLENELFGEQDSQQFSGTATVQYRPFNVSEIDSNEELDSFFGDKEPNMASTDSQAFDPSVTAVFTPVENKLQGLFREESHSLEEDEAGSPLFEDILKDASDIGSVEEPTTEAKPIMMGGSSRKEGLWTEPQHGDALHGEILGGALDETLDETIGETLDETHGGAFDEIHGEIREEAHEEALDYTLGESAPAEQKISEALTEDAEDKQRVNLYDELFSDPELSPEERANYKFYTFNRNTDAFKELLRRERERLEEMGADYVPQNLFGENSAKKPSPQKKPIYISTASPAITTNIDATGEEPVIISGPGCQKLEPNAGDIVDLSADEAKVSDGFKYADIFSGTEPRTTVTSAGISISEEKLSQKTEKAQQLKEFFDEIDNEDPKRGGIFGKLVLAIFIIALLLCGTAFGSRHFFPDSKVAEYPNIAIEKCLGIIDRIKGSGESEEPAVDDVVIDTNAESKAAYLAEIISTASANLKTVGEVYYSADENLSFYNLSGSVSEELSLMPEIVITDGVSNYDAAPIISATLSYYDSWLENNTDANLLGINKLEIGDLKTNGETGYVLCRVFFATESGEEAVKVETVRLAIGETEATVVEVLEENLQ